MAAGERGTPGNLTHGVAACGAPVGRWSDVDGVALERIARPGVVSDAMFSGWTRGAARGVPPCCTLTSCGCRSSERRPSGTYSFNTRRDGLAARSCAWSLERDQPRTAETAHGPLPRREFPLVFLRGLHCQHSPRGSTRVLFSWYCGGQGRVPCIGDTTRGAIISAWAWQDRRGSQRRKGNSMSRACKRRLKKRPSCTRIGWVPTIV